MLGSGANQLMSARVFRNKQPQMSVPSLQEMLLAGARWRWVKRATATCICSHST